MPKDLRDIPNSPSASPSKGPDDSLMEGKMPEMPGVLRSRWAAPVLFTGKAIANPRKIGALLPSTSSLGKTMAYMASGARIVELGPGSGSITRHLLARLPLDGRLLALELDAGFAQRLGDRMKDPRLDIRTGDANDLPVWLQSMGWDHVDAVVSGLPFQAFSSIARTSILDSVQASLTPAGRFVAFQYGLRLLPIFREHFRRVHVVGPVWWNFPPAYVIIGRI